MCRCHPRAKPERGRQPGTADGTRAPICRRSVCSRPSCQNRTNATNCIRPVARLLPVCPVCPLFPSVLGQDNLSRSIPWPHRRLGCSCGYVGARPRPNYPIRRGYPLRRRRDITAEFVVAPDFGPSEIGTSVGVDRPLSSPSPAIGRRMTPPARGSAAHLDHHAPLH